MALTTALAIYFIVWWLVLFTVLPFGVKSQEEHGSVAEGTDPGAPAIPRLGLRLIVTTVVSGIVFGALYVVYVRKWVTLDDLATIFGLLR
jgi:predicted secreted protein